MRSIYVILICLTCCCLPALSVSVPARYISEGHATIAIIGAGDVGATTAYALMLKNVGAEMILVDIDQERCYGEVLDLTDALPFCYASKVRKGELADAGKADIIVITAGARRRPGQTRIDLIKMNKKIISSIVDGMQPINPNAVIIVVSNPADLMTYVAQERAGLPKSQVFGSGTWLDTQRLRGIVAHKLGVSEKSVQAYIIGEHGDSQIAAWFSAQVGGIPITSFEQLSPELLEAIEKETMGRGLQILTLKRATYYGIAACVADICVSIINNDKRILPVSSYLSYLQVCLSMPAIIGEHGIEAVMPLPLSCKERKRLERTAAMMRDVLVACEA